VGGLSGRASGSVQIVEPAVAAFVERLYAEGRAFDAGRADRLERRRNLEPDSAALLAVLTRAVRPARILEIGTSNGYSTIWLADAAADVGATVTTVEIDAKRSMTARANLRSAGDPRLSDVVDFVVGDAADHLRTAQGSYELILLDAERPEYVGFWPDLLRVLRPAGGLLVVDNVLSHADQVAGFRALVEAEPAMSSTVASVGAGLLLAVRR
jgi:predicted O-methyltransferase YrrM